MIRCSRRVAFQSTFCDFTHLPAAVLLISGCAVVMDIGTAGMRHIATGNSWIRSESEVKTGKCKKFMGKSAGDAGLLPCLDPMRRACSRPPHSSLLQRGWSSSLCQFRFRFCIQGDLVLLLTLGKDLTKGAAYMEGITHVSQCVSTT